MHLYRTARGPIVERDGAFQLLESIDWDGLLARRDLGGFLRDVLPEARQLGGEFLLEDARLLPPIQSQEVWAAGVTFFRSRDARMEEARDGGGGDFYDRVYTAERPELFLKATPHRVSGHGGPVRVRRDSRWTVPEPELTLVVSASGTLIGYTVGNDMSARDIEGENPLYLPQAKTYDGSCALGPGILVREGDLPATTRISIAVTRGGQEAFAGSTTLAEMKRSPAELIDWLGRESAFPAGCFLMTGTGVVPPPGFSLVPGDEVSISIEAVGTLTNKVI